MKRVLRVIKLGLVTALTFVIVAGALLAYFVYSPDAVEPKLSGTYTRGSIEVAGLVRTYRLYVPGSLARGSPLVVVMHGSGESGGRIRMQTGYAFDRLADQHSFAVVYPDSYSFDWNDCSVVGDFSVDGRVIDDIGFLTALTGKLIADRDLDPRRVFATGVSAGGFMSIRLALEEPTRFRAVAAVSANLPAPENFKCRVAGPGPSVLLVSGTQDPLVPFDGGEVSLLGLFYKNGNVLSARASGQYFATLNRIGTPPTVSQNVDATVERSIWRGTGGTEVELLAIVGGGHGLPQAAWRRPRLLGPSPMTPDGPAAIWSFFERQRR